MNLNEIWDKEREEIFEKIYQRYHRESIDGVSMSQVAFDVGWLQGAVIRLLAELKLQ